MGRSKGEVQSFITENYYTCTKEILSGLSQMYVDDERFKHNIDQVGGEGTAEFVRQAASVFCSRK
ncbi:MAG: TipAS antibiotic-recognition domain-containing protein [Suilimivivens sp.]